MAEIKVNFIDGLPHIPYANGVGGYIGVAAHCTGNYGDKLGDNVIAERNFEVQTWGSAFVHFFCDDNGILQVADINYKAYGAGSPANGRYVHVELCQTHDHEKFLKGYSNYIYTLAYVLAKKSLGVYDEKTLVTHSWISHHLGGTDHADPIAYLSEHGKKWADVVKDVQAEYNRQKTPVVPTVTPDVSVAFICKKIKSVDEIYWKKQANSVQFLDVMVQKIATQWMKDNKAGFTEVKKIPPLAMTVEAALAFIDSKVHLSDYKGWILKSKNVQYLDQFFIKIAYVWGKEGKK